MTDDNQLSDEEAAEILDELRGRDIINIEMPTGWAVWFTFDEDSYDPDRYTFEVNLHSGNLWLHHHTDDGKETVWENKRSRY